MNIRSSRLAKELALWLEEKGYPSKRVVANLNYRQEEEGWQLLMHPELSHRYVAVRSGVGSFGWSGNVGMKGYGTAILLGTTVTEAELEPTEPIPAEESFCDDCKLCVSACASGLIERKRETPVTLGGVDFTYSAKRNYMFCQFVCGGFTGLHPSGKWSTWSPGRYGIPEEENELFATLGRAIANYQRWPERTDDAGGYVNPALTRHHRPPDLRQLPDHLLGRQRGHEGELPPAHLLRLRVAARGRVGGGAAGGGGGGVLRGHAAGAPGPLSIKVDDIHSERGGTWG